MKIYVDEIPKCCAECEHCTKAQEGSFGIPFCNVARLPIYNGQDVEGRGHHKGGLNDFDCPMQSLQKYNDDKDHQIKVLEKALELMAISYYGNSSCIMLPNTGIQVESNVALEDYYKQQAEEMLKGVGE